MKRRHDTPRRHGRHAVFGWLLVFAFALIGTNALAHKPSDSHLSIDVGADGRLSGRWDIALRDLDFTIGLDADGDGNITWGELRARHADIAAYALARLTVSADGEACRLAAAPEQLVDHHTDGAYTVLELRIDCAGVAARKLALRYALFADVDPQHRGLLRLSRGANTQTAVLEPARGEQAFELAAPSRWRQFGQFAREGVWHIWIGFDHILFLVSLLLPAVLVRTGDAWQPASRLADASIDVLKIVTAFTVAHSITLSLATLEVVSLPSALVESTIAASVVLAALNNVWPLFRGRRWVVAFGFGLVHGFGFASVLGELGLPSEALLIALVAFNLGVEAGQLVIVAAFLPVAFALRATPLYRRAVLHAGSLVIAALAGVWFVERAFGLELLKIA